MRVSVANVAMPSVMKTGITRMAADQHNTVLWHPNNKKTNPGTQHPGVFIAYISKHPLNLHLYPVRRNLATTAYRQCQHRRCMAEIDIGNHRKFL